jgi:hypothetical protein
MTTRSDVSRLLFFAVALGGCIAKSAEGGGPQTIRETGYLACAASAGCEGTLCVTAEGVEVCEPLPESCVGAASCACAGEVLCGAAPCTDAPGGVSCGAPDGPDSRPDIDGSPGRDGGPGPDATDAAPACAPTFDPGAGGVGSATLVLGQSDTTVLNASAGGCDTLRITELRVEGDPGFEVTFVDGQDRPVAFDDPDRDGAPGQRASLRVTYTPATAGQHRAVLVVVSNAGESRVELEGTAILCTEAVLDPVGVFVAPGLPVPLFAQYAFGGIAEIDRHEWMVVRRPEGSVASIGEEALPGEPPVQLTPDDPTTPLAVFAADVPGIYTLVLRSTGPTACEGDVTLPFYAPEMGGLAAVVEWAPADGAPAGTTATLHLLAPEAMLGGPDGDCFAGAAACDWGVVGDSADDPEIGVQHGAERGMAALTLPVLAETGADGAPYRLGITLDPTGAPPAPGEFLPALEVTVRIYQDGVIVANRTALVAEVAAWLAAEIRLVGGLVEVRFEDPPI